MSFDRKRPLVLVCQAVAASLFIVSSLCGMTAVHAQASLPTLGDSSDLTTAQERQLGDRIIRELYRDPDYIDDAVLNEYVYSIFQPLVKAARERGELSPELDERFAWEILLGRDRTVNAFALPGGYFGVHLGLIGVVSTRDELASVMAHELSHVTQRHISRLITQQNRQTPLMLGALVLGALAASKSPNAAQALMIGGQAVAVQNQLNFSRDMEREADRVGYGLMAPAGFAPQGFVAMFDKLQQANRINDNGSWPYLRSHPLTTQRIADMHSRLPPSGTPAAAPLAPSLEHVMMAARARVLARPGVDVWRQWTTEPQGTGFAAQPLPRRAAAWYAAALSASQLQDVPAARHALLGLMDTVRGDAPATRQAKLLGAEIEFAAGDFNAALQQLPQGQAQAQTPGAGSPASSRRPEMVLRTQALLRTGNAQEMTGPLQTRVATHPHDATVWHLLAAVWQQQNHPLRAVRAEAEAHAARYDYQAAVDRFKAGQDLARKSGSRGGDAADYIDASIIETRLRAVELLLKEQAAER
ncbi:Putative Zn-dependent protease, contains TPR repeats [Paracidovorax valerianellae]|uniref:Putative Zn-dependent protease, contains TPR repeats n=2 Tax=Paracidovorax valerianellae TaxID=187868 RepID=A0A1G6RVV2_9BURK|nr:Putative Zn-dependent protease, contains TPR repeats [Paracidovorax valerianellae]